MPHSPQKVYDVEAVRLLFDEMSATYGVVNLVSSFGFTSRWRSHAVLALPVTRPAHRVADLMSGMGELWRSIGRHMPGVREVVAVDLSHGMMKRAPRDAPFAVEQHVEDILQCRLKGDSFDAVVSSFGLKTLSRGQQRELAAVVARLLRPGGSLSFVEISVPRGVLLRSVYLFYIDRLIPVLGRLFMGNPANYRLLGTYTRAFGDSRHFVGCLRSAGLVVEFKSYFFGCATGVVGLKPMA